MEARALREGRATFTIDLHPAYSANPLEGVQLQLESRILRWDDGLGGVLLAYKNLQKLPTQAAIRPYFPYIELRVKADVLIFKPSLGDILCGQVTKLGADFIGMTLLGSINAAVGRQNIRGQLRYNLKGDCWEQDNTPSGKIELGSDVLFSVDGLRIESNGILAVLGAMKEPWTGAVKAAAFTWPSAFPDPQRWQAMQPQAASLDFPASTVNSEGRHAVQFGREDTILMPNDAALIAVAESHPQPGTLPVEAPDEDMQLDRFGVAGQPQTPLQLILSAEKPKKQKKRVRDTEVPAEVQRDDVSQAEQLVGEKEKKKKKKKKQRIDAALTNIEGVEAGASQPTQAKEFGGKNEGKAKATKKKSYDRSKVTARERTAGTPLQTENSPANGVFDDNEKRTNRSKHKAMKNDVSSREPRVLPGALSVTKSEAPFDSEKKKKKAKKKRSVESVVS